MKSSEKPMLPSTNTFDDFWALYPKDRRMAKPKAETAFARLSKKDQFNAIQGLKHHIANNPQWRETRFIPMPATFLNQRRWEDPIPEFKTAKERVVENGNRSKADTVWSAMTQMYGEAWIKKHGESPTEIWKKLLAGMTETQIKRGLRATFESGNEFPPGLPKFAEYCKGGAQLPEHRMLPKPKGDPEKAMAAIEEMKRILGVK